MSTSLAWAQAHPAFIAGLAFIVLVILVKNRGKGRKRPVDPKRLFTPAQKAEAGRRSGHGRCEHKAPMWFRCRANGAHGDHIYPHSRGGATTMSNLQLLCATHNLRKSAKVPSAVYILRLERRRARYFPAGTSGKVEWRIGRAS